MKSTPVFEKLPFEVELISDLTRALSISHRDDEGFCKNCLQYDSYKHSSSCEIGNLLKLATEYVNDNKPRLISVCINAINHPMDLA